MGDIAAFTVLRVQLKEMSHNNIKTFIGACDEPGHICYLMQMCSRGTVQVRVRVRKSFFYRAMLCIRCTSRDPVSVCVCPTVTSRSSTKTAERIEVVFGM